jgi:hypothetical protein
MYEHLFHIFLRDVVQQFLSFFSTLFSFHLSLISLFRSAVIRNKVNNFAYLAKTRELTFSSAFRFSSPSVLFHLDPMFGQD